MYYRRKILLALLQKLGGSISSIDYQKQLFLLNKELEQPYFHFVPYKFGCFSFQSYADRRALVCNAILKDDEKKWAFTNENNNYIEMLSDNDKSALENSYNKYGKLRSNKLIRYVYLVHPFYAINSQIVTECLTEKEQTKIYQAKPKSSKISLFTIGYEGLTLDEYFNKLLKNNVRVLCDVRKNALSMKYGFSKNQLKNTTEKLNIKYIHIPELGIESSKRQKLETQVDYDHLFDLYERTTLKKSKSHLEYLFALIKKEKRVALTCFEKEPSKCHRTRIASALQKFPQWKHSFLEF